MGLRHFYKIGSQIQLCIVGWIFPSEPELAGGLVKVPLRFLVDLGEGYHHLVAGTFESLGQLLEVLAVKVRWRERCEENGIVAPNCHLGPVVFGKRFHVLDGALFIDDRGFELVRIGGNRILNLERSTELAHVFQPFHKGSEVLGPEDEAVHVLWQEADSADLASVVGIGHLAVSGLQSIFEPLAVEGRDIRLVAGGDNHVVTGCVLKGRSRPYRYPEGAR